MIGTPLCRALLKEGHDVTVLTRNAIAAVQTLTAGERGHDGEHGERGTLRTIQSLDEIGVSPSSSESRSFDAVVNLAGEPIAGGRWNDKRVQSLFQSRCALTRQLVTKLAALPASARPSVLVSGSAIGFYGVGMPDGREYGEDDCPVETASLPHRLCAEWEAEAQQAQSLGIRVVQLRIGYGLRRVAALRFWPARECN